MPTAEQVLDIARSKLGYHEKPGKDNVFGIDLNENHVSWCALFQLDNLYHAGFTYYKDLARAYSYCPTWFEAFQAQNLVPDDLKPGYIVFYNWSGGSTPEHVGMIESVPENGAFIVAIEGNTSNPAIPGSQSNGGWVERKTRSTSLIVGVGRPLYV